MFALQGCGFGSWCFGRIRIWNWVFQIRLDPVFIILSDPDSGFKILSDQVSVFKILSDPDPAFHFFGSGLNIEVYMLNCLLLTKHKSER